ncbi:MAG TPA: plastocyanin/azurin family copper-binding protein [Gemmatimonadaceae bacterium]|nr:plastocyanin/azurin family copper-binding protein [Gemmatimonadaceae bacterium]
MRVAKLVLTVALCPIIACGGGGGSDGGTTNPPPPATVSSVSLSRSTALIKPAESVSITATPKDASGNAISGKTVTWNNANSSVVSISPNGATVSVTGTTLGTASITATVDQITSPQAQITVTNSFATSLAVDVGGSGNAFTPNQADIASGATVTFTWSSTVVHNVTWTTAPGNLPTSSGDKGQNSTLSVTLTTPGTYNYHCTIHAGMEGSIQVH